LKIKGKTINRTDFHEIGGLRLLESRTLLAAGFQEGAYYLAGDAVECALKACIARRTREHNFPDKKLAEESRTHDLRKLLQLAQLSEELETAIETDPAM
jgi:HEPN domain-containing protein